MDAGALSELTAVLAVFFSGMVVLTPIVALSLRFAMKPAIEAALRLRQTRAEGQELALHARRMELLETEIQHLHTMVQSLAEAEEFRRQLGRAAERPREVG